MLIDESITTIIILKIINFFILNLNLNLILENKSDKFGNEKSILAGNINRIGGRIIITIKINIIKKIIILLFIFNSFLLKSFNLYKFK